MVYGGEMKLKFTNKIIKGELVGAKYVFKLKDILKRIKD